MTQSTPNFNDFLDNFESQGATLSRPVLNEGNYKADIVEITSRSNLIVPTKGPRKGKEVVLTNWGAKLTLDSQTAQEVMKQDNDVMVFADQDTINMGRGLLNVGEFGISFDNNIAFWTFVGSIFAQVGLATKQQDDSGAASYKLDRNIINSIYQGTQEELADLQNDSEINELLIPSKLAKLQLKNISELVTSESDTRKVYVHIARRTNFRDKTQKEHFVRQIMLPEVFEAREENITSLIL